MHHLAAIENIFFLALIAIVGLVCWIAQSAEEKRNNEKERRVDPPPNTPPLRAPATSTVTTEEERVRKFMEALGLPAANAPAPKTPPRTMQPRPQKPKRRAPRPIDPFPRPNFGPFKPAELPPIESAPPVVITPPATPAPPTTATMPVSVAAPLPDDFAVQKSMPIISSRTWAARLGNPDSLRDAIILREIFGPPPGLESFARFRAFES